MDDERQPDHLPFKFKGIEHDFLVIDFRPDGKTILILKDEPNVHVTLSSGHKSGIIEAHKTITHPDGSKEYQPLGGIQRKDLLPMIYEASQKIYQYVAEMRRPVRLGWLRHRNFLFLYIGSTQKDRVSEFLVKGKRKRAIMDQEKFIAINQGYLHYDEILDFPHKSMFMMYKAGRMHIKKHGILFKFDVEGYTNLFMLTKKDFKNLHDLYETTFTAAYKKYGLSPDEVEEALSGFL